MLKNNFSSYKRFLTGFFMIIFMLVCNEVSQAQVTLAGAVALNGPYTTLKGAFDAINLGVQTGLNINITITGNTVEPLSAVLNQGAWTSVSITPVGGAARAISGSIVGPLINFNSADNVTIDGINSGSTSLTITNQSNSSVASTIQFINEAKGNLVTNCTIQGASTGAYNSSLGATILFSTATSGTGNDNNTISNNDIGPFGANLPYQAIKSFGTATRDNKNNIIDNNLIHDFFQGSTSNAKGILVYNNSTNWVITNNRIYQTATRAWISSGANVYSCIDIEFGSGYLIAGNTLGFSNSTGTGYSVFINSLNNAASHIHAIIINQTTSSVSTINSNIVAGFDLSSSRTSATFPSIFIGIYLMAGNSNVTGNTIGSSSVQGSIYIRHNPNSPVAGAPPIAGIYSEAGINVIDNNNIGGIDLSYSGPVGFDQISLIGIWNKSPLSVLIQNNTIGGAIANSLTSSQNSGSVVGINNGNALVQVIIQSNTVRNLNHSNSNTGVNSLSSVIGILEKPSNGLTGNIISDNLVYNLNNNFNSNSAVIHVRGIVLNPLNSSSQNTIVERNWIHTLNVSSTAIGSSISGIHCVANGTGYLLNNMISLGNNNTTNLKIIGILQNGMAIFAHHNSIRIMGTATGTDLSACFSYTTGGFLFRSWNNIFYNERTGGSNNHYAFHSQAIVASYQASYNLYYTSGPAFVMYNNTAYATLATFSVATGQNNPLNTKQLPVVFTSATDLHTADLNVRNAGWSPVAPPVTLDFDNMIRPTCVDIGCDEYDAGSIPGTAFTWIGNKDTKWCEPCNWDRETVPTATDDAIIQDDRTRYPLLQLGTCVGNETIHDFTMIQNANPAKSASIDLANYTLSVTGNVSIAGTCTCTGSTAFTALTTGLIDLTGTTQSQSVDIRGADGTYPGTICKLRVNKTQPTGVASANHEAYLRGNLNILYNLDFANGVLISKTAGTFDANELTAVNYKTINLLSDEPTSVTRQTIAAQNTRNGFFQGRLNRKIKSGVVANEYLFPLGFRLTGGTGVLANYFYAPALLKGNSIANNQYLTGTYLHDQNNPTADGVGIGFTGHGCLNAFEIDDQGGATATTCNNKEIDILSNFYWDFQESTGPAVNGNPVTVTGALGAVDYDLETAGDMYALLAQDGLTGSELRLLQRPSVVIPGNAGQGPFVTTAGTHDGVNISANTGIAQYSIVAASLKGARRDNLTTFGGFASAGNGPSPLPVELLFFKAEKHGEKSVLCSWETATEINNDHFEVEAARDHGGELVFEIIGTVQGSGTSSISHSYSFLDEHPMTGMNYYRLRQVDYDGTAGYSKMVVVQFNSGRKFDILATSPNPFVANPVMYLQTETGGALVVQVENAIGQIVYRNELMLSKGSSSLVLSLPETLSSGLYFVRTIFDDEQMVGRLMKQ